MNIIVVGGAGFIGYHTVRELLARGHSVSVLARRPMEGTNPLPAEARLVVADLDRLPDGQVQALLQPFDAVVFAGGADDRVVPKAPAYRFFYDANVRPAVRLFTLARQAGVKRGVLLGSYFAHFDRAWPELGLSEHHPYIWSRIEQERQSLEAARPGLELMILELPYIFGSTPGRRPLWAPLIAYIRSHLPLFYPRGGTNAVAVQHVAEAVAGALEVGTGGERYLVGEENLTWAEMLGQLAAVAGRPKRVITLPDWLIRVGLWSVDLVHTLQGKEGGLHMVQFARLQTANTFFDPTPSRQALGYGRGKLAQALRDTVDACRPRTWKIGSTRAR